MHIIFLQSSKGPLNIDICVFYNLFYACHAYFCNVTIYKSIPKVSFQSQESIVQLFQLSRRKRKKRAYNKLKKLQQKKNKRTKNEDQDVMRCEAVSRFNGKT